MSSNKLIFTTMAGLEIPFEPASAVEIEMSESSLREEYKARGETLDVPTYEVEIAGSTPENPLTQTFEHDETTLATDEQKAKWAAYLDANRRLSIELAKIRTEIVLDCLKVELPKDTAWMDRQRRHRIKLPEDLYDLRHHYIRTEILKSAEDLYMAMQKIIVASLSGSVDEETIEAGLRTFRNSVREAGKQAVEAFGNLENDKQEQGSGIMEAQ